MTKPPLHQWNISAPIIPLHGGHRNMAFRTSGLAQELVFKSTRRTEAAISWLQPVHHLAKSAGFLAPNLLASRTGCFVEAGWTCEVFLAGRAFLPEEMPRILPNIEAFHHLATGHAQRPGFLSSTALVAQGKGGDVDLSILPAPLARICRQAWASHPPAPLTVVHGDLNPSNLILCESGEIGLIDWDECRVDAPIFDTGQLTPSSSADAELALKAWEVACSWQLEPDYAQRLAAEVYCLAGAL